MSKLSSAFGKLVENQDKHLQFTSDAGDNHVDHNKLSALMTAIKTKYVDQS